MTDTTPTPSDPRPTVAVIGLGAMGATIARTLIGAGHPTLVWNRSPERAEPLVALGAKLAESPGAAVETSDLTLVSLLDDRAVRQVFSSTATDLEGAVVVNLTSSTPEESRATATWFADRGSAYLDGAIMVPTPLVGDDEALLLLSGDRQVANRFDPVLAVIAGERSFLGDDPGLAALHDLGLLDLYFAGLTGYLHAAAMLAADGISADSFLAMSERMVVILGASLPAMARDLDTRTYPGDEDTLAMELVAMDHVVATSAARGIDTGPPRLVRDLIRRAVDEGHGADGFSRVIEQLRTPR